MVTYTVPGLKTDSAERVVTLLQAPGGRWRVAAVTPRP